MSNKINKLTKQKSRERMKALGYTKIELDNMERYAERHLKAIKRDAEAYAFVCAMIIPLHILAENYWPKTANQRIPEFLQECLSVHDSLMKGVVTLKEMEEVIQRTTGFDFRDFCNKKEKEYNVENLW